MRVALSLTYLWNFGYEGFIDVVILEFLDVFSFHFFPFNFLEAEFIHKERLVY